MKVVPFFVPFFYFMFNRKLCRFCAVFYRITYKTHSFSVIFVSGKYNDL